MSRSKRNWDYLVEDDGQYPKGGLGQKGAKGDKGGGGPADKGLKGEPGVDGTKGEKGRRGEKGLKGASVKGLPGVGGDKGEKGQTGVGASGDKGEKGTKGDGGTTGAKGEKGVEVKGEKGTAGTTFNYQGEVANEAALPPTGNDGDIYKATDTGDFYAWNGASWDNVGQLNAVKGSTGAKGEQGGQGDKGDTGEKGTTGGTGSKGEKGDDGLAGTAGDKGDKGELGFKGEPGIKGNKGGIGVKGETGSDGAKGIDGSKGDAGAKGEDGTKGEDGAKGDDGVKGDDGTKGEGGDKGDKGEKGRRGEKGLKGVGDTGEKGEKGQTGIGTTGDKGDKGEDGGVGSSGPKGQKGLDGNGDKGQKGEKGLGGTDGDKGETGAEGAKGNDGDQGTKGDDGNKGDKGEAIKGDSGQKGDDGDDGAKGDDGVKGQKGADVKGEKGQTGIGLNGDKGEKGQKGINGFTGAKGDEGDQGQKGEAGRTFNYQGEVANEAALPNPGNDGDVYKATDTGDFYAWNGSDWDNIGQLNAVKGADGQKGDDGDTGPKGDRGDKGIGGTAGGKGEKGDIGNNGNDGDKGSKGQKGVEADGSLYLPLAGGTVTGDTTFETALTLEDGATCGDTLFFNDADDDDYIITLNGNRMRLAGRDPSGNQRTFISFANVDSNGTEGTGTGYSCNIYHLATPSAPHQAANQLYVDDKVDTTVADYLPLAGGDITGSVNFRNAKTSGFRLYSSDSPTHVLSRYWEFQNGESRLRLGSSTEAKDFKITGYISGNTSEKRIFFWDSNLGALKINNVAMPNDDDMVANKAYVDTRPPGMRFEAKDTGSGAGNLAAGEFLIAGGGNIYINPESYDGVDLGVDSGITAAAVDLMCSIWDEDGNLVYSIKGEQINYNNSSNNYIRVDHTSTKKSSSVTTGNVYYISIPGITS